MKKYVCTICGYIYDEASGIKWSDLPDDWRCPWCGAPKSDFKEQKEESTVTSVPVSNSLANVQDAEHKGFSFAQMSALCSNFAKGCEKQYLQEESELFMKLADYFKTKAGTVSGQDMEELREMIRYDLENGYVKANAAATTQMDRGALRALVWSEKVTRILNSLLSRYEKEQDALLEHTNVYVCEICGFIHIGEEAPEICPVCKVPRKKIGKIDRR